MPRKKKAAKCPPNPPHNVDPGFDDEDPDGLAALASARRSTNGAPQTSLLSLASANTDSAILNDKEEMDVAQRPAKKKLRVEGAQTIAPNVAAGARFESYVRVSADVIQPTEDSIGLQRMLPQPNPRCKGLHEALLALREKDKWPLWNPKDIPSFEKLSIPELHEFIEETSNN